MNVEIRMINVAQQLPEYGKKVLTVDDKGNWCVCRRTSTDADGEHWHIGDECDVDEYEWFGVIAWGELPLWPGADQPS